MAVGMFGANTDELRGVATLFGQQSDEALQAADETGHEVEAVIWIGADADRFRADYDLTAQGLRDLSALLAEHDQMLQQQAEEQDSASGNGQGGSGSGRSASESSQSADESAAQQSDGASAAGDGVSDNAASADRDTSADEHSGNAVSGSGGPGGGTKGPGTGRGPVDGIPVRTEDDIDGILNDYQTSPDEDGRDTYAPLGPIGPKKEMSATEAEMLRELSFWEVNALNGIKDQAYNTASEYYPKSGAEDGLNDAFRHTYWNALMARERGVDWAEKFATAHEAIDGNPAYKEAMDLHNNELGRRIYEKNPNATPQELAELVRDAVESGQAVAVNDRGELVPSNKVDASRPTAEPTDPKLTNTNAPSNPKWDEARRR